MRINIPANAAAVIRTLEQSGYEAYVVGGCVRDALLGREPNDWDVTTSARPEQTMELFTSTPGFRAKPTGIAHGTVTVLVKNEAIETTTFRIDGEYTDCRRPDHVDFTDSLREDLARRDFTINAMAYSDECGLCDPYGGEADLAAQLIRCVGDPMKRFSEDALRIMRAMRFSSVLGFRVDEGTRDAAIELRGQLVHIAKERIHFEMDKLLEGQDAARVIGEFYPVIAQIIPEIADSDVPLMCERIARLAGAKMQLRLAAMLVDAADVPAILSRLRFSRHTISIVSKILANYRAPLHDKPDIRRLCRDLGMDVARYTIQFAIACGLADEAALIYLDEIFRDGDCLSLSALRINGRTLLKMGVPSHEIGTTLNRLLERVILEELENNGDELRKAVRKRLKRQKQKAKLRARKQEAAMKGLTDNNEGSTSV